VLVCNQPSYTQKDVIGKNTYIVYSGRGAVVDILYKGQYRGKRAFHCLLSICRRLGQIPRQVRTELLERSETSESDDKNASVLLLGATLSAFSLRHRLLLLDQHPDLLAQQPVPGDQVPELTFNEHIDRRINRRFSSRQEFNRFVNHQYRL
jgi:hypothetical protein